MPHLRNALQFEPTALSQHCRRVYRAGIISAAMLQTVSDWFNSLARRGAAVAAHARLARHGATSCRGGQTQDLLRITELYITLSLGW
jgi:hypothetical protein